MHSHPFLIPFSAYILHCILHFHAYRSAQTLDIHVLSTYKVGRDIQEALSNCTIETNEEDKGKAVQEDTKDSVQQQLARDNEWFSVSFIPQSSGPSVHLSVEIIPPPAVSLSVWVCVPLTTPLTTMGSMLNQSLYQGPLALGGPPGWTQ